MQNSQVLVAAKVAIMSAIGIGASLRSLATSVLSSLKVHVEVNGLRGDLSFCREESPFEMSHSNQRLAR